MPTYEYICEKCGHEFEKFQPISASPLEICPQELCGRKRWGKGKVKRAISGGAGLLFKGNGFYITDYRSEGYQKAAKKEKADATSKETNKDKSGPTSGSSKTSEAKKTKS